MVSLSRNSRVRFSSKRISYAGTHLVADFWRGKAIKSKHFLKRILLQAAQEAKATPLKTSFHAFSLYGMTGVALLGESHIALHTWPEIDYIAIDIFTCGKRANPRAALDFFKKVLKPERIECRIFKRGKIS